MDELELIREKIYEIRGQRIMLDKDLANLYGVEVKVLNQAVKRNIERFPDDFMFQLNKEEADSLRSQIVTIKAGRGEHRKYFPYVFTEQGVAMLSSVLKSKTAIEVNIRIMRAFVAVRNYISMQKASNDVMDYRMKQIEHTIDEVLHDQNEINEDTRMRLELIEETLAELQARNRTDKPKSRIGFV